MIRKYRIGNPIPTDSVVKEIVLSEGTIPYFDRNDEKKELTLLLKKNDRVYGLGETVRGMNKRGWLYTSNNSDDPNHTENKHSLYASQNFLIVYSKKKTFGIYIDTPGFVSFDIGYTLHNKMTVSFEDFDADIYIVDGDSPLSIVASFRHLIGRSYIPPKWAFGFGQSRWSYLTAD